MNIDSLQLDNQFRFDESLDFITEDTNYDQPLVMVYPQIAVVDKNGAPAILLVVYGSTSDDFKKLSLKTTSGETRGYKRKGEYDDICYYFLPTSKSGEITLSDGTNTYLVSWDIIDEYTTKFTNHYSKASILFLNDYGIIPEDTTKLKEYYIELYQSLGEVDPEEGENEYQAKFKTHIYNKLQELQKINN